MKYNNNQEKQEQKLELDKEWNDNKIMSFFCYEWYIRMIYIPYNMDLEMVMWQQINQPVTTDGSGAGDGDETTNQSADTPKSTVDDAAAAVDAAVGAGDDNETES